MTTFIKAKLKKTDGHTKIYIYKVVALKISHNIISKSKILTYHAIKKPKKRFLDMNKHF